MWLHICDCFHFSPVSASRGLFFRFLRNRWFQICGYWQFAPTMWFHTCGCCLCSPVKRFQRCFFSTFHLTGDSRLVAVVIFNLPSVSRVIFAYFHLTGSSRFVFNATFHLSYSPVRVITNILKKTRPKRRSTSWYDGATGGLGVVQRMRRTYLACICFNKNKDGN
jgi:hypothetical protein